MAATCTVREPEYVRVFLTVFTLRTVQYTIESVKTALYPGSVVVRALDCDEQVADSTGGWLPGTDSADTHVLNVCDVVTESRYRNLINFI